VARRHAQPGLVACAGLWAACVLSAQPRPIARLDSGAVNESSGVVASRQNTGIYWTHNDSGDGPNIFAFNLKGHVVGRWTVTGARNVDWEDIAIGPGPVPGRWYLYIGDIGSNDRDRRQVTVYRVEEPKLRGVECRSGCKTAPASALRLRYPDRAHNAETLMMHPKSGDLYIVSKASGGDLDTIVFAARAGELSAATVIPLKEVATLDIPEPIFKRLAGGITGGDISPDGTRVVLCDYLRKYEAVLPAGSKFDAIWERPFTAVTMGLAMQVEGICYSADGKSIIATSEGSPCPVLQMEVQK
jgi:hypothetical protein